MFKFLIILILVIFIFGRLLRFLFKYAIIGMAHKHGGGNFRSEPIHNSETKKEKTAKKYSDLNKGGDYIDYEIV